MDKTKAKNLARDYGIVLAGCSMAWVNENTAELGGLVGQSPFLFGALVVALQQGYNRVSSAVSHGE
jgi:hypothetical protein